jgi:hypothetical protein
VSGLDRDGLRRIAEAATEGPWRVESRINANVVGNTETIASGSTPIADCWGRPQSWREPDARHIAAFDPPTALALLDTADAHDRLVAALRALADEWVAQVTDTPSAESEARDEALDECASSLRALLAELGEATP